jgi:hypothetical protein
MTTNNLFITLIISKLNLFKVFYKLNDDVIKDVIKLEKIIRDIFLRS